MELIWIYLPLLVPVILANLSERHRRSPYSARTPRTTALIDVGLRVLPYSLLVATNLGLLLVAGLALLNQVAKVLMPQQLDQQALAANWLGLAAVCLLTSAVAFVSLLPAARRRLARWLPIDPDSIVHTTALAFAVYQVGLSVGVGAIIGDLENLTKTGMSLTPAEVVLGAVPLVLFALLGVGLFIRRSGRDTLARLGLVRPTWGQLLGAIPVLALLMAFGAGVNYAWQQLDPAGYALVDRVTNNLFGGLLSVGGALVLGLSAGISEELLFRGAVQPRLGLLVTTFLFTVGHLQYGLTIATLEVFVIGLVLGLIRNRANTTICILIHASYNAMVVLLGLV